jgi:hypothetical protein
MRPVKLDMQVVQLIEQIGQFAFGLFGSACYGVNAQSLKGDGECFPIGHFVLQCWCGISDFFKRMGEPVRRYSATAVIARVSTFALDTWVFLDAQLTTQASTP